MTVTPTKTAGAVTVTPTLTAKPTTAAPSSTANPNYRDNVTGKVTIKDGNGNPVPAVDENGNPGPIHDTTVIVRDKNGKDIDGQGPKIVVPVDPNTGKFEKDLPEGEYIVEVNVPDGYAKPKPTEVVVKPGTKPTVPPFEVNPTTRPLKDNSYRETDGTISGWLVDDANMPIRDGSVTLIGKNAVNPKTGEPFEYEVPVTIDDDGYFITPVIDFKYFPDGKAEFEYEVHLPEGWSTTGPDGKPLTDANGNPLFDKDGKPLRVPVIDKETGSKIVTKDQPTRIAPIQVPAPTDQSISGTVDDGDGHAVPGTVVVVTDPRGNSHVVETDENGKYEVDKLVPGVHEVEIITPDGTRKTDKIVVPVRPGENVDLPSIHVTQTKLDLKKRVFGRDADYEGYAQDENGNVLHDNNGKPIEDVMTVGVGEELFYTFIITNTGDQDVTGISADSVDDPLLAPGTKIEMPKDWTAQSVLAPGKSVVFSAKMQAPDAFDFNNVATVSGKTKDGKPVGSNADGAYTKFMQMEAEKKVNARFATNPDKPVSVAADEALNFSYEVVNTGSAPMVNVKVTDTIYEGDKATFDPKNPGEGVPLKVKAPAGFNGTLLPGQRVIFTAEIPEGRKPGVRHFDAAEARGELPKRPNRGTQFDGEPDYSEDPSSELIISPRDNIKGNAHIIVDEGAPLAQDVYAVAWSDKNGNAKQDPGEGVSGLEITLVPTDGRPAVRGESNEDGNVRFESAPYGEYYFEIKNPGNLRLADPADPNQNSFEAGTTLKSKTFEVGAEERQISLKLLTPSQAEKGGAIIGGNGTATDKPATDVAQAEDGSSLGKCLATASSVNNPVAWLVPLGLLAAVMGGIGMRYEDELNAAAAQANEAVRRMMPNVNLDINFQQPEWVTEAQAKWQAQINQVNAQLAEINPAAPAAAAGVGILAIAGLLTGLFYASCQLGWNEPSADGSSSSSKKGEAEATGTEATETATTKEKRSIFGGSSKRDRGAKESEAAETKATEAKAAEAK